MVTTDRRLHVCVQKTRIGVEVSTALGFEVKAEPLSAVGHHPNTNSVKNTRGKKNHMRSLYGFNSFKGSCFSDFTLEFCYPHSFSLSYAQAITDTPKR